MSRQAWTPAEDAILRQHARIGLPAISARAFWAQLVTVLTARSAAAIFEQADVLHLWARSTYGAVERKCPDCGDTHVKREGSRNPATVDLCIPCVRRRATERRKENHKFTCVRCKQEARGGRRRRVCDPCKLVWGDKRLRS